ncbi:MAG: hypothetical protein EBZ48_10760, partial [Proteobacteria bacterium]|nr:hypothetical protein [Pseudomonadota bacterium]
MEKIGGSKWLWVRMMGFAALLIASLVDSALAQTTFSANGWTVTATAFAPSGGTTRFRYSATQVSGNATIRDLVIGVPGCTPAFSIDS